MKNIRIKFLSEDAIMPKKAHSGDAGFDVFVPRDTVVFPGRQTILLDFALELPEWHQAQIEPRSGFSSKGIEGYYYIIRDQLTGLRECGELKRWDADVIHGKIDSCYRGNIGVIINSHECRPFTIEAGTKLAQMTIYELPHITGFEVSDELTETDRGDNGFGSTGK